LQFLWHDGKFRRLESWLLRAPFFLLADGSAVAYGDRATVIAVLMHEENSRFRAYDSRGRRVGVKNVRAGIKPLLGGDRRAGKPAVVPQPRRRR
jgi:hypothetical protein